jgi:epoxyqueuosine reductase
MKSSLTERIKHKAIDFGFSKIGIARAEALSGESVHLQEWLTHGYHASMHWMERETAKRIDPSVVLPNVKSVLCVAMNYFTPAHHSNEPTAGKISRYAWGDDYHDILSERLEKLLVFIKSEIPGATGKIYVDTGPVMEKAWAVRAGIGWMGKHANVITPELGSWVFLGEILLDAELEYDEPLVDHCGACTVCLDACPTGAIAEPYVVDANKCISYLTIEHRSDLPSEFTGKFQNWIYGCDICQDVCPWNRFQKETKEKAFQPRAENIAPKLTQLAVLSQEEFSRRFKNSPIKRTKQSGLVRNAKALLESHQTSS